MLDKSKPYGTVSGVGADHVYEQCGKNFDGQGNEIWKTKKPVKVDQPESETIPIETRLLIIDKNANGYLSVKEIKAALTKVGVAFNPRSNHRKSLLNAMKTYMGVN